MAKDKTQWHGTRPCVVVEDSNRRERRPPLIIEYTDDAGGLCRVSADDLTNEEPIVDDE